MRVKRDSKTVPAVQLCLFSEIEMERMTERIVIKPVNVFTADPAHLRWQLEIGQSLRGKEGREYRRMYAARRRRVRVVLRKPPDLFFKI